MGTASGEPEEQAASTARVTAVSAAVRVRFMMAFLVGPASVVGRTADVPEVCGNEGCRKGAEGRTGGWPGAPAFPVLFRSGRLPVGADRGRRRARIRRRGARLLRQQRQHIR
ncbi:hypothetical protein Cde04nite_29170 [Cellulomonas denverensis]|nr:hypothetical protein Cde04nite_29170 [Cellulomonas denverensis]